MTDELWTVLLLAVSAFLAGAINSIAGGGTLLTFPALASVISPALANATSTVALLPGSFAGAFAYRKEVAECRRFVLRMLLPSVVGGYLGARLVSEDQRAFEVLVPWLILTAAVLFLLQHPLSAWLKKHRRDRVVRSRTQAGLVVFQFLVALYGGYFGAGIGILMLTSLSLMGMTNIHQANGVKTVLAAAINAASVGEFLRADLIVWHYAGVMACAAVLGGYGGARVARRLPVQYVRWAVIAIGFGLAAFYFVQQRANGEE